MAGTEVHSRSVNMKKPLGVEPSIPLISAHKKSSDTMSDGDHLPLKSRENHDFARANCSQSDDKGALVRMDKFEAAKTTHPRAPKPMFSQTDAVTRRRCIKRYLQAKAKSRFGLSRLWSMK
jgi:hypothetical protein